MTINANPSYNATKISATATIKTGDGCLGGIFVSAASSTPTITVYDGTSTSGTNIVGVFTPAAATYYPLPIAVGTGIHVVISGTVTCSVLWV